MLSYIKDSNQNWTVTFALGKSFKTITFDVHHPQHDKMVELIRGWTNTDSDDERINILNTLVRLHNVGLAIHYWSDGNFCVKNGAVTYKNNPVDKSISDRIMEMISNGFDYKSMLRFLENLYNNPSNHSVTQLYKFLEHKSLPITEDGCFLAYKAVTKHLATKILTDNNGLDISEGDFVDIYTKCSHRNNPGDAPTMERCLVSDDFNVHCHAGLHVSTLDYAEHYGRGYGGPEYTIVLVKVNPADVVSVPNDYMCQKVRCCKYEVLSVFEE